MRSEDPTLTVERLDESVSTPKKDLFGIAAAIIAFVVILLLPTPEGLSLQAQRLAALFVGVLILWSTEALPNAVTALIGLVLQPLLGLNTLTAAFTNFMSPIFFFLLAMFTIGFAWVKTGLARRFALWMIARSGTDARRALYVLVIGAGLMSTVLSDPACVAIFMAIALPIFDKLKLQPGKSQFAKSVMIGIPLGALAGSVGTPVGASSIVLGLLMIEQNGGPRIGFLQWMAIGVPMILILLPAIAWTLTKFYPPELKTIGDLEDIQRERTQLGRITSGEWKLIAIMTTMLALWLLQFETVLVALGGAIAMLLPRMKLLRWKEIQTVTGWDAIIMIGGVTSLAAATTSSGLAKWIVESSIGEFQGLSLPWVIALVSAFTVAIHLLIPINPVIPAVIIPPLMAIAAGAGLNPGAVALPVAFTASCGFLLPLDAVPGLTYSKGYYRMFDMFLPGLILSVLWIIVMTGLLVIIGPMVGLV